MGGTRSTAPVGGDASVTIPDQSTVRPALPPSAGGETEPSPPVTEPGTIVQPDDPEPVKQPDPQPQENQGETPDRPENQETLSKVFTWPVPGAVLRDFSVETLSLDPTMGDWRTHGGLDIAAAQGVEVKSISAGTVEQVYTDGLMGITVVVDHGGGLTSWYCNLAEEVAVEAGDSVNIGDTLGTVGTTAIAEVGVDSHIHLETLLNGQPVDPKDYLK